MESRTTFLIAHRLSSLRGVHRVLVFDHGQLIEQGTPEELIDAEGLYAQFHAAQGGHQRLAAYADSAT